MKNGDSSDIEKVLRSMDERWSMVGPWNLPYRILLLAKMIDRLTAQHVQQTGGMSLTEWRSLTHVAQLEPCTASKVASIALVDRAEVSRALHSLEKRELVQREPNPKNRKANIVRLTEKGRKVHNAIRGERGKFFTEWVEDLSEEERKKIDVGLQRIAKRIVSIAPHLISP